jgi:hypothetical protein
VNSISPASSIPNAECCGIHWYDTTSKVCCGEKIYTPVNTKTVNDVECCFDVGLYDPDEAICCESFETIIRLPTNANPDDYACCSRSTAYDTTTETCCSGIVSKNENFLCCGSKAYDPTEQLCCTGNHLLNYKDDQACCGTNLYNTTSQVCCAGTIHNIESDEFTCCGTRYYDPRFDTCCFDSYVLKGNLNNLETIACCGENLIDYTVQVCCNNKVGCGDACCKDVGYHTTSRSCCSNNLAFGDYLCCGSTFYDPSEQLCCGTKLYDLSDGLTSCCGTTAYDATLSTCCAKNSTSGVTSYTLVDGVGTCCYGTTSVAVYDPAHEVCCSGNVECGDACCGKVGYFTAIQSCDCSFKVVQTPNQVYSCCGTRSYDPNTQTCCVDVLFDSLASGVCCGRQYVDTTTEVCCSSP